jgi:transcriptional regulator with XRE-family HTH domain
VKIKSADHLLFGRVVREIRARRVLSQEGLGQRSGLHRNYVGAVERGEINPTLATILTLCRGLNVGIDELFELYCTRRGDANGQRPGDAVRGWQP